MCFGSKVVDTTTKQELPAWLEDEAKRITQMTAGITDMNAQYVPYGGERLAGLTTELAIGGGKGALAFVDFVGEGVSGFANGGLTVTTDGSSGKSPARQTGTRSVLISTADCKIGFEICRFLVQKSTSPKTAPR